MKKRILFVCIHNSARSQMAEELMRKICGPDTETESAGLTPGALNPLAIEVLLAEGIDIRGKETRDVFDVYKSGKLFSHVITVCDEASAERCPIFPGVVKKLHWSFPDPSQFEGTWEEKLQQTRDVRESIKEKIFEFCESNCEVAV
ncbi:MAG: arsenate reductase ArsC [bacterium]